MPAELACASRACPAAVHTRRRPSQRVASSSAPAPRTQVDVSYLWLRGTRDDGTFTRVNRVILTRKRPPLRRTARVDKAAIELVSQGALATFACCCCRCPSLQQGLEGREAWPRLSSDAL